LDIEYVAKMLNTEKNNIERNNKDMIIECKKDEYKKL